MPLQKNSNKALTVQSKNEDKAEPIRLQKYFSDCGVLSRRACEGEISAGHVKVNGVVAVLGDRVLPNVDTVEWNGQEILPRNEKPYRYVLLNKPRGWVCTAKDEKGRRNVTELVKIPDARLYPVGRLDMDSDGLLLLTDDGEFANLLTHPRHEIAKRYRVAVSPLPTGTQLDVLRSPMELDGYKLQPVGVKVLSDGVLEMELHEGRNRQIRRMCEKVGLSVVSLTRIAIGKIGIGDLKIGKWRNLTDAEVAYLKGCRNA